MTSQLPWKRSVATVVGLGPIAVDVDVFGVVVRAAMEVVVHIPFQDIVHRISFLDRGPYSLSVASYL